MSRLTSRPIPAQASELAPILKWVRNGLPNAKIAEKLGLTLGRVVTILRRNRRRPHVQRAMGERRTLSMAEICRLRANRLASECHPDAPLPAHPTSAQPGSPEKIAILAARCSRFEALHHPGDARAHLGATGNMLAQLREARR